MVFHAPMAEGMGLTLQVPVPNRDGSLISSVVDKTGKALPDRRRTSLRLVASPGPPSPGCTTSPAGGTSRYPSSGPVYDNGKCAELASRLAYGVEYGPAQRRSLPDHPTGPAEDGDAASRGWESRDSGGILHADLHIGNLIVSRDTIVPIDFSFCGYGYYLFDLSITLSSLKPHLRVYSATRLLPN